MGLHGAGQRVSFPSLFCILHFTEGKLSHLMITPNPEPIKNIRMRETQILLEVLSHQVYHAKIGGMPIRDVMDFRAWLLQCAKKAELSTGMEDFLLQLDK